MGGKFGAFFVDLRLKTVVLSLLLLLLLRFKLLINALAVCGGGGLVCDRGWCGGCWY